MPQFHDHGTNKLFECTNANGIVRIVVGDQQVVITIHYDYGITYTRTVELPHILKQEWDDIS